MTAPRMITAPPMVGVPRLVWWASGRSTWMSWPSPRLRKVRMASGVPTSPRASATAAAIRMPTTRRRPPEAVGEGVGHAVEGDDPAGLDQDHVVGAEDGGEQGHGGVGVGDRLGLLGPHALHAGGVDHHPAQLPHPDEPVDAQAGGQAADAVVLGGRVRAQLGHLAEHGHRAAALAAEGGQGLEGAAIDDGLAL